MASVEQLQQERTELISKVNIGGSEWVKYLVKNGQNW